MVSNSISPDRTMVAPSPPLESSPGSRRVMQTKERERVIIYNSPSQKNRQKVKDLARVFEQDVKIGQAPLESSPRPSPRSLSQSSPAAAVGTIKAIHPQMVIDKLKPLKDDFMHFYGSQHSISQLSFSVNDSAANKTFEQCYEKQDILGEGGFAIVYRCFHYERMHNYAVKEILDDNYECEGENLKEEIDALKRLREVPYIVRLMDVFYEPGVCYVVMEEMKGGDLLDRLCEIEVYDEPEARQLSRKLLEAIYYCHKKHVVHRDIKPENILLTSKESNTSFKLGDFGCSRRFEPGKLSLFTLCGSPQYVAPELYTHQNGYDERCDWWSAAIVMYVILGGYAPFDGADYELPSIICDGYFEFHQKYWDHIPEPPKDLIRSLLKVNPQERVTLEQALDSDWLKRRDREKIRNSNMDGSMSSFEAWCHSQGSGLSGGSLRDSGFGHRDGSQSVGSRGKTTQLVANMESMEANNGSSKTSLHTDDLGSS